MKKHFSNLLLSTVGFLIVCIQPALAGHPLLQNGWLKSATDTSVTLDIPQGGEMTFNFAPAVKIEFADAQVGTAADIQAMVSQMGTQRIIVNIRRDAPESSTAVIVGLKAPKPVPAPPAAEPAAPAAASTPAGAPAAQ